MIDNKIYIFGHRGASGYCIENTLQSFKKACEMNAHIETDLRLTKDNILIAFHDPGFKLNGKYYKIRNLTLEELRSIEFDDGRNIPTLAELFECFSSQPNLKFSFDIANKKAGVKLIKFGKEHKVLDRIFITDIRIHILKALREYNADVNLVHTIPHKIAKLEPQKIDMETLKQLGIEILNIKANRYYKDNFAVAVKHDFNCFFWGVNTKIRMKRLMKMEFNGCKIDGIYTNYPDHAVSICKKLFNAN
jgi:glycerophosphoryl diester phosphodiesterase